MPPPIPPLITWLICNLILVAVLGSLILLWFYFFTDWFETAIQLLALGGVLSLFGNVFKILDDGYVKPIRTAISVFLNSGYGTLTILGSLGGILLFLCLFLATLQIEGGKGGGDARVNVYRRERSADTGTTDYLPANGRLRTVWLTSPWSKVKLRAAVTDLPEADLELGPAWFPRNRSSTRVVPTDFLQPVALIGAQASLVNAAARAGKDPKSSVYYELRVIVRDVDGKETPLPRTRFDGHSIWVGVRSGELKKVPAEVRQDWKTHLEDRTAGRLLITPRNGTAAQWSERLAAGYNIEACLIKVEKTNAGGKDRLDETEASKVHVLLIVPPTDLSEIVQPLLLELK